MFIILQNVLLISVRALYVKCRDQGFFYIKSWKNEIRENRATRKKAEMKEKII